MGYLGERCAGFEAAPRIPRTVRLAIIALVASAGLLLAAPGEEAHASGGGCFEPRGAETAEISSCVRGKR